LPKTPLAQNRLGWLGRGPSPSWPHLIFDFFGGGLTQPLWVGLDLVTQPSQGSKPVTRPVTIAGMREVVGQARGLTPIILVMSRRFKIFLYYLR